MAMSKTVMGKRFKYRGSLDKGISVDFHDSGADWFIPAEIIDVIKHEIAEKKPGAHGREPSPARQGQCRRDDALPRARFLPAAMTYVLPLLVEAGFCTIDPKRPFLITVKR